MSLRANVCDPWKISGEGAGECAACAAGFYPSPINMRRLCRRNLFGSQCFDFDIGVPIGRVIRVQYHNGPIGRGCVDLVDGNLGTLEKMRTGNTVDNDLDRLSSCFDPQTRFAHIVKIFHRCPKPLFQNSPKRVGGGVSHSSFTCWVSAHNARTCK